MNNTKELTKELVRTIELLGNQLKITTDLAENIKNAIKKKEKIYNYNVSIIRILRNLRIASEHYTYFHSHYLGKLAKSFSLNK